MESVAIRKQIAMKTPAVSRLHVVSRLIDELSKDLDRVEFLEDDIVDKRKFKDVQDLTTKAKAALTRTRDALAKSGGSVVAKGYK